MPSIYIRKTIAASLSSVVGSENFRRGHVQVPYRGGVHVYSTPNLPRKAVKPTAGCRESSPSLKTDTLSFDTHSSARMEPSSWRAASLGPSESRKRSRPKGFHDTGHHVTRVCLDPSAESFMDELPTVSDVASPKWMQNGMARTSHALENNLPGVQTNMKNTGINWSALPDPTVSSYLPNPEFNIGVTNESMQPEVGSWSFSGSAGDFNTSTKSPYWNLEYQYAPFETHHRAFDNNPDTAEVAYNPDTNGSWNDNSCQFISGDAIDPAFQFPSQPAPQWQNIPLLRASINENNLLSPSTAHLMSETSCEVTSNFSLALSSVATAVVPDCSELVGMLDSSCPALGCTTLSESLEYGTVSLEANPDRNTAECDLCLGVVGVFIFSTSWIRLTR
jgi:hypothetical protein